MHEAISALSGWGFHYGIRSAMAFTLLIVATWLADRLLRKVGPAAQHRVWVACLLLSVLLPVVPTGLHLSRVATEATGARYGLVSTHMVSTMAAHWTISPSWAQWIGALYLAMMTTAAARLLWQWRQTRQLASRSSRVARVEQLEYAARHAGIAIPDLRISAELDGPVALGWRKPLLLVPERFFLVDGEDIAAALAHECAHIVRRDYARNLAYEFMACALAWHPLLWWLRHRLAATREEICDEIAAGAQKSRSAYAASLLRLAQTMAAEPRLSHAIGVFDGNQLEERIMRMTNPKSVMSRGRQLVLAAGAGCALLGGAWTATAVPVPQTAVYHVGGDVSAPVLTYSIDAKFPKAERKNHMGKGGWHGIAEVALIVDPSGTPRYVHITRSLAPDFDRNAVTAVRQYRFKPAMRHGQPVAVDVKVEVNYRIY